MFAPHTTHFTRTLPLHASAHPTTRRKLQVQDENNKLPSKTPSRSNLTGKAAVLGLVNTAGPATRLGLGAKTEGRDRNVLRPGKEGSGGSGGKGKGKDAGDEIAPKRLFANPKLASSTSFSSLQPIVHPVRPKTHQRSGSTFGPGPSGSGNGTGSGSGFTPTARPTHGPTKTPARAPPTARRTNLNLRTPAPTTSAFRIARDSPPDADVPPVPAAPEEPAGPAVLSTPLASAQRDRKRRSTTGRSSLSLSGPHRLSGSGGGPSQKQQQQQQHVQKEVVYKTPAPAARRYYREGSGEGEDGEGEVEGEGDSMDSIQLAPDLRASIGGMLHGAEVGLDVLDEDEEEEEASDGEVEYMPPKVSSAWQWNADQPRFTLKDHLGDDWEDLLDARGNLRYEVPVTPPMDIYDLPDLPEVILCPSTDEDLEDPLFRFLPSSSRKLGSGDSDPAAIPKKGSAQARSVGAGTSTVAAPRGVTTKSSTIPARSTVRASDPAAINASGPQRAAPSGVRFASAPVVSAAVATTSRTAGMNAGAKKTGMGGPTGSAARSARTARPAPTANSGGESALRTGQKLKPGLPAMAVTRKPAVPAAPAAAPAPSRRAATAAPPISVTRTATSKVQTHPALTGHRGTTQSGPAPPQRPRPAAPTAEKRGVSARPAIRQVTPRESEREMEMDAGDDGMEADLEVMMQELGAEELLLDMDMREVDVDVDVGAGLRGEGEVQV